MSLLDEFTSEFVVLNKVRTSDGAGGFTTAYTDGVSIKMAQKFDNSMESRRAQKDGVKSVYTFLAPKNCGLEYHDILRRVSDGQHFRITSNSGESITPASSALDLTSFSAERWELQ